MTPDFVTALEGRRYESAVNPALSTGKTVTASATLHAKGVWTELLAASAFPALGLIVTAKSITYASGGLLDIGVGPSDPPQVLVPDLWLPNGGQNQTPSRRFRLPLAVKPGSRIWARYQGSTYASQATSVALSLYGGGALAESPFSGVDGVGVVTASSRGTVIDSGATSNTKGAWTELVASTARPYRALMLVIGSEQAHYASTSEWLLDLGVGAGGSEQIVVPDLHYWRHTDFKHVTPVETLFPLAIPRGSRVAARTQCSTNTTPIRHLHLAAYGLY